mmetsp:Transcript_82627/g.252503  ORF Transcript_82627/g.252503 Transcript_82627/m.252503 type:complete len:609 (+) Transcript_82627:900-2726(+)
MVVAGDHARVREQEAEHAWVPLVGVVRRVRRQIAPIACCASLHRAVDQRHVGHLVHVEREAQVQRCSRMLVCLPGQDVQQSRVGEEIGAVFHRGIVASRSFVDAGHRDCPAVRIVDRLDLDDEPISLPHRHLRVHAVPIEHRIGRHRGHEHVAHVLEHAELVLPVTHGVDCLREPVIRMHHDGIFLMPHACILDRDGLETHALAAHDAAGAVHQATVIGRQITGATGDELLRRRRRRRRRFHRAASCRCAVPDREHVGGLAAAASAARLVRRERRVLGDGAMRHAELRVHAAHVVAEPALDVPAILVVIAEVRAVVAHFRKVPVTRAAQELRAHARMAAPSHREEPHAQRPEGGHAVLFHRPAVAVALLDAGDRGPGLHVQRIAHPEARDPRVVVGPAHRLDPLHEHGRGEAPLQVRVGVRAVGAPRCIPGVVHAGSPHLAEAMAGVIAMVTARGDAAVGQRLRRPAAHQRAQARAARRRLRLPLLLALHQAEGAVRAVFPTREHPRETRPEWRMQVAAVQLALLGVLRERAVEVEEERRERPRPTHAVGIHVPGALVPSQLAGAVLVATLLRVAALVARAKVAQANRPDELRPGDMQRVVPRQPDGA